MAAHRSKREEDVEIAGEVMHETEKALLLNLDDTGEDKWFPLSVINDRQEAGSSTIIKVQYWFADKEGLI